MKRPVEPVSEHEAFWNALILLKTKETEVTHVNKKQNMQESPQSVLPESP